MKKKKKMKIIINSLVIFSILGIITWLSVERNKEDKIQEKQFVSYHNQNIDIANIEQPNVLEKEVKKEYLKEEIISQYKGYPVIAKLWIPAISLETYILEEYSTKALNISVTKFWGANPNESGNFCVAGHNFQNKNMFYHLKDLKIGDKIFVSDSNVGKVEYEIYDLYRVEPNDVNCLSQETNGKKEITLITCTNDSKKRIIIKAKEWDSPL